MNSDKLIEAVIRGGAVISAVRKINKSISLLRVISYISVVLVIAVNALKLSDIISKQA